MTCLKYTDKLNYVVYIRRMCDYTYLVELAGGGSVINGATQSSYCKLHRVYNGVYSLLYSVWILHLNIVV